MLTSLNARFRAHVRRLDLARPSVACGPHTLAHALFRLFLALSLIHSTAGSAAESTQAAANPSRHWSLQPLRSSATLAATLNTPSTPLPTSPALPRSSSKSASPSDSSIIDAFIRARLATNNLTLSPPADRSTLIRRVSFDLTGLPPTPEEIDRFVRDRSPKAYIELVERLLASPRYGERWGRHWLDLARYTESQGFEYDRIRDNAWHYRDYVIQSFNTDKPYDRFMKEQIAGDVLEPISTDGIVGSSLLVCGPYDEAGNAQANATQRAITREDELEDLIGVVGQTFLGLTLNCARCHAHKFDPIPLEEYYRIKSVFDGVKHGERTVATATEAKAREERIESLKRTIAKFQEQVSTIEAEGWTRAAAHKRPEAAAPAPTPRWHWQFQTPPNAPASTELRGGALIQSGQLSLPTEGAFFQSNPIDRDVREKTLEAWVSLANLTQGGGAAISIESDGGGVFDAIVYGERQPGRWTAGSNGFERTRDLGVTEETSGPGVWIHLAAVYNVDNTIALFRNGEPYGKPYKSAAPIPTFKAGQTRVLLGMRHTGGGKPFLRGALRAAALHDRALSPDEIRRLFRAGGVSIPESEVLAQLTREQLATRKQALNHLAQARTDLDSIKPLPVSYVGTRIQPPPTKVLLRGDVKSPKDIVTPGALSSVQGPNPEFGLPADAPEAARRLKFAEWLTDPRNPLPARVMANRVWHFHFGQGLVSTPNDFGVSGARPSHPELLDWLAAKLIENGWSLKSLHRLIVHSETYQQSSSLALAPSSNSKDHTRSHRLGRQPPQPPAHAVDIDADNTLLWRFSPRRLEAEAVRDAILAVSGTLNPQTGGPSFRSFEVLKFPANAYQPVDKIGPEFNRRTVYRMNVNSGKEPLLDAFDCPDPAVKTPRRGITTTPLQALGLMNNSFVQRHASILADRALRESSNSLPTAIRKVYQLTLGRNPTQDELKRATAAAQDRNLSNVCWALLNSTEFIYVR